MDERIKKIVTTSHCEKRNQTLAPFTHTDFTGKLLLRDHV